jgi:type IV secretion system protein VirB11
VQEAVLTVPRSLIAEAIDLIVFIAGRGLSRRVQTIARVAPLDPDGRFALIDITPIPNPEGE